MGTSSYKTALAQHGQFVDAKQMEKK